MDGIHDLGGKHGYGAIVTEPNEPVFHGRWEARVFACLRALGGQAVRSADQFRYAIERIDPAAYLSHGYYGRWLGGLETLAREAGLIDGAQLQREAVARGASPLATIAARPGAVVAPRGTRANGPGSARPLATSPRFALGAQVRTARDARAGHTRLPAYARDRVGRVVAQHGSWVLPDSNAEEQGEAPCHLYGVEFAASELWGAAAEADVTITLDLFEPYLSPAESTP